MKKKILSLLALSLVFSCNAPNNIDNTLNNKSNSYIQQAGNEVVIDVSQGKFKGADLTLNIKDLNKRFSVKQSQQGTVNLFGSVKSYMVYLIKNSASTYPTDGSASPLDDKVLGPYVFNVNNNVFPSVRFTNVPPSGGDYYYFAVRVFDGMNATGTEIIKPDNGSSTPWAGSSMNMPIAVSSGSGIMVDNDYVVSSTTAPIVEINTTLGATGAAMLDARVNFLNTSASSISSYEVNFCTDPANPTDTKVLDTPFMIPKGMSFTDDVIQLTNIPTGKYYLTISKASETNPLVPNLISDDEDYDDSSTNLVVSSNYVTIDNNQQYTFSDGGNWFKISVPLVEGVIFPVQSSPSHSISTATYKPGIAVASDGTIYVVDRVNHRISKIAPDGSFTADFVTGIDSNGIAVDSQGRLYVTDVTGVVDLATAQYGEVRRYNTNGTEDTSGGFPITHNAEVPTAFRLKIPTSVSVDASGNVYVSSIFQFSDDADPGRTEIVRYDSNGNNAVKVAGRGPTAQEGDIGSVSATAVDLKNVVDIEISANGSKLYLCELQDTGEEPLIRQVDFPSGLISSVAGGQVSGQGNARLLSLENPSNVTLDSLGNVYISETNRNRVLKLVNLGSGEFVNVAGLGSENPTTTLPLISATDSSLVSPYGLAVDKVGNLYITDNSTNVRISKVIK